VLLKQFKLSTGSCFVCIRDLNRDLNQL